MDIGKVLQRSLEILQKDAIVLIVAGLIVSLAWTARRNRMPARDVFGGRKVWLMAVLVLAVMVFQHTLKSVGAAGRIGEELQALRVPVAAVVMALPLLAGMVTGLAVGFVGTSFPIVLAAVAAVPDAPMRPYVVLAYAFGHLGQMLSPLHLCHVMSNKYFQTRFAPVYRYLLPAAGLAAGLELAYFLALLLLLR